MPTAQYCQSQQRVGLRSCGRDLHLGTEGLQHGNAASVQVNLIQTHPLKAPVRLARTKKVSQIMPTLEVCRP